MNITNIEEAIKAIIQDPTSLRNICRDDVEGLAFIVWTELSDRSDIGQDREDL